MTEKLMTVEELSEKLGLSITTIYQAVWKKRIPAIKVSKKCLRFDPTEIRKWLESKKTQIVEPAPKQPVRKSPGRPRKNNSYINRIVEQAKREAEGS